MSEPMKRTPFLVKLTPQSLDLLTKASIEQEKTKTGLINEAIKSHLAQAK